MITVYYTTENHNRDIIEFQQEFQDGNNVVLRDFQVKSLSKWELVKLFETSETDIYIFITNNIFAYNIKRLFENYERLLNIQIIYINNKNDISSTSNKKSNLLAGKILALDLPLFFNQNISTFEKLTYQYTNLFASSVSTVAKNHIEFNSDTVFGKSKHTKLLFPRQLIQYLLMELGGGSSVVGRLFKQDHSSISHNAKIIQDYISIYATKEDCKLIEELKTKLGEELCK